MTISGCLIRYRLLPRHFRVGGLIPSSYHCLCIFRHSPNGFLLKLLKTYRLWTSVWIWVCKVPYDGARGCIPAKRYRLQIHCYITKVASFHYQKMTKGSVERMRQISDFLVVTWCLILESPADVSLLIFLEWNKPRGRYYNQSFSDLGIIRKQSQLAYLLRHFSAE